MKPYYQDEWSTIYLGDCREILPELPKVDLVLTDPPYGIGLEYDSYKDTDSNLRELINSTIPLLLSKTDRMALTCGVLNMYSYPKPDWVMAWVSSAGIGCSKWGFCCWQPILVYGNDPYLKSGSGRLPDLFQSNETTSIKDHPCSKPIILWSKVLKRCSQQTTDLILDPFMGSGTTLVAAKKLGRKAIGIEISEKYCEIAVKRLQQAVMQFEQPKEVIKQESLI
jgi:DNA modification methylase